MTASIPNGHANPSQGLPGSDWDPNIPKWDILQGTGYFPVDSPPEISDHQLICPIKSGSYGEVWLARSVVGTLRAVKIVRRSRFDNHRPYDREFRGIQKYEPVSRIHPGLVNILHLARNEEQGFFYYVMELADAACFDSEAQEKPPAKSPTDPCTEYHPRTLRAELDFHRRLPAQRCAFIGARLAEALAFLHARGLVHRDVKPSNIIFVNDQPKLADIGLVAQMGEAHSFVGTDGFVPPEGPGSPQADIYSLGKLLYEAATGMDRNDFPELPSDLDGPEEKETFAELNQVILKACEPSLQRRYRTAEELSKDLNMVLQGVSLGKKGARKALVRKVFLLAGLLLSVILGFSGYPVLAVTIPVAMITSFFWRKFHERRTQYKDIEPPVPAHSWKKPISLAILPFEENPAAEGKEYLGQELAEECAGRLARLPDLKILPSQSARALRSSANHAATARNLGCDVLLEGKIRRDTDRLVLFVEMVDVRDEFIRWSQSYSVKPAEIFAVETDILLNITRQLDIPVTETQQEELAHSPTRNVTAYDSYLLGRRRLSRRNPEGFIAAMESFEQAIASDPGYARAYAGLAEVYLYLGYGFGRYPGHEAGQKALENARKAIQLEPDLAHGYAILAATHFLYQIDGHDLEALFSKALELDPDCTTARHFYSAWLLIRRRDSDKAIEQARIALKTDPLSLQLNNWLGMMFYFAGRYEEALQHAQQWLSIVPQPAGSEHEIGLAHKLMGRSHEMLEREPEAISDYLQEMECFDVPEPVRQGLKQVYETQGWEPFWRAQAIGMEKLWANGNQPWLVAYEIAIGWARLKEVEKVIEWLDMLRKAGCSMMVWLPVEPFLDPLRNDPLLKQWLSEG